MLTADYAAVGLWVGIEGSGVDVANPETGRERRRAPTARQLGHGPHLGDADLLFASLRRELRCTAGTGRAGCAGTGTATLRGEPVGYRATTPVGSYPPNRYGLFDMAGSVWESTSDWYVDRHPEDADKPCCIPVNPTGGALEQSFDPAQPQFRITRKGDQRLIQFVCRQLLHALPAAARRPLMVDTGMSHTGLRCLARLAPRRFRARLKRTTTVDRRLCCFARLVSAASPDDRNTK